LFLRGHTKKMRETYIDRYHLLSSF
jgi:hypothetical protein